MSSRRPATPEEWAVRNGTVLERALVRCQVQPSGCWHWTGATKKTGYGTFNLWDGDRQKTKHAHVLVYELLVGAPPEGLEADHLCLNRICVNPDHIDWVTHAENVRRSDRAKGVKSYHGCKTHCPAGHPYSGDNLYVFYVAGRPRRMCRQCKRDRRAAARPKGTTCICGRSLPTLRGLRIHERYCWQVTEKKRWP